MMHSTSAIRLVKKILLSPPAVFFISLIMVHAGQSQIKGTQPPQPQSAPVIIRSVMNDVSRPLRTIVPQQTPPELLSGPPREMREPEESEGQVLRAPALDYDPVVQDQPGALMLESPTVNFEAMENLCNCYPPDPNGDISPDNYVQTVNTHFAVYNRAGTLLYGPALLHTIWDGFTGPWTGHDDGDPVVLYDHLANRWIISQFAILGGASDYELVAVSQTSDPLGAWYRYAFAFSDFPDYPKISVWPDAYYLTFNRFNDAGSAYLGMAAAALERDSMLAGHSARIVLFTSFTDNTAGDGLLPSDVDGPPPPAGSPAYFSYVIDGETQGGTDRLGIYAFHVDWSNPPSSTFSGPTVLSPALFNRMCTGTRSCIPQLGTGQGLDIIGDRLMYRLQYRNFGGYQAMVVNHSVDAGSTRAGVRWYEFRNTGSGWSIYQQSTYAPADGLHRWMGSIAMDKYGNIGLGYSASSSSTYPAIRYTGRRVSDPLGQMTATDSLIMAGTGAQTGSGARWGDYSMMSIDPSDDATFWFTHEYLPVTSPASWHTRVAAFQLPPAVNAFTQGVVTDSSTSLPIAGASIDFTDSVVQSTGLSQPDGAYFVGVKVDSPSTSATHTLRVRKFGYNTYTDTVTVVTGDTVTRNVALSTAPGGRLAGRVFRSDSAGVQATVQIRFNGELVVGDLHSDSATGSFSYPLPNGTYDVTVDPPSPYASRQFPGVVVNSDTPFVSALVRYVVEQSLASVDDTLGVGQSSTVSMTITNTTGADVPFSVSISGAAVPPVAIRRTAATNEDLAGRLQQASLAQSQGNHASPASPPDALTSGAQSAGNTETIVRDASVGTVINSWTAPAGISYPWGLAWNKDATNLLVSDAQGPPIENHYVSDQGVLLQSIATPWVGGWPADADYDAGHFYQVNVGGNNGIYKLNVDGSVVGSITDPDLIWSAISQRGLAYDPQENVFYIGGWNQNIVYKVKGFGSDNPGKIILSFPFQNISGLAFHPTSHTLWIADNSSSDMIYEVNPSNGQILQQFQAPGSGSYRGAGLAIHEDGNLWCVNQYEHKVYLVESGTPMFAWLSAAPTSGTLAAGSSVELVFTFDATDLTPYTGYDAIVHLHTDHPDVSGSSLIPASLFVKPISGPAILVKPLAKDFGGVPLTHTKTDSILVRNIGDSTLNVSSLSSTNPLFTVSPASATLLSGDGLKAYVAFTPLDSGTAAGIIHITSNDPLHDTIHVNLSGTGVPVPHFSTLADSLNKTLEGGALDSIQFYVRNDGTGSGTFSARAVMYTQSQAASPGSAPVSVPLDVKQVRKILPNEYQGGTSRDATRSNRPLPATGYPPSDIPIRLPDQSLFRAPAERPDPSLSLKTQAATQEHLFGAATNTISEINMSTGLIVRSFPTPVTTSDGPTALAFSGTALYFTDAFSTPSIYVLDPTTGATLTSYAAPSNATDGLAFVDGKLYAQNYASSLIYELNPDNGQVLRTITPPVTIGGGLDGGNGRLFASNFGAQIYELNITTGAVVNSFVPVASIYGLGFTGTRLFATVPGGGIAEYNPNTGQFLGMISNFGFAALAGGGGGASWLSILPTSGIIPLQDSTLFVATFDATSAGIYENPGEYAGRVEITATNSSLAESLNIPARMTVIPPPGPRLTVNKSSLSFDTVGIGLSHQLSFRVKNIGAATLIVTDITTSHPQYAVSPTSFTLASLETTLVTITFSPTSGGLLSDTVQFVSNDSLAQHVLLSGTGLPVPHFTANVDSLVKILEGGTIDSLTFFMYNIGSAGGSFTARAVLYSDTAGTASARHTVVIPMTIRPAALPAKHAPETERHAYPVPLQDQSNAAAPQRSTDIVAVSPTQTRIALAEPGKNVLIIQNNYPWGYNVIEPTLDSMGASVSYATSTSFYGLDLSQFDLIVIPSSQTTGSFYSDIDAHLALLESFVSSGGVLEYHATTQGQNALLPGGASSLFFTDLINTVVDPGHPIVQGVPSSLQGSYASHNYINGLPGDATIITKNQSNYPTTAEYPLGAGHVIVTGMTWEIGYALGWNFARMLPNALDYSLTQTGASWLSVKPHSGTLAVGDSTLMVATFDATSPDVYENPGNYFGRVQVAATSTSKADTLKIPARMLVVPPPGPRLTVDKSTLRFDTVGVGLSRELSFRVKNIGAATLTVTNAVTSHPQYSPSTTSFTLASLETLRVKVTFLPTSAGPLNDTLRFISNDPDAQSVALKGVGLGIPHFMVRIDSLTKSLPGGARDSISFFMRNTGSEVGQFYARAQLYPLAGSSIATGQFAPAAPVSVTGPDPAAETPKDLLRPGSTVSLGIAPRSAGGAQHSTAPLNALLQAAAGVRAFCVSEYIYPPPPPGVPPPPATRFSKFTLDTPGAFTLITPNPGHFFAGDLGLDGMFYGINIETNQFIQLDTLLGLQMIIGASSPAPGETWTALKVDPTTGIMYASSSSMSHSTLYTVNPATGAATAIGSISNGPAIITIAINNSGQMYGIDIAGDLLVSINPSTAAGTVIGPIGFDANYAQDADFDPASDVLYYAAFNGYYYQAEFRTVNLLTGATTLVGYPPYDQEVTALGITGGPSNRWLSVVPSLGQIAVGDSLPMRSIFDASSNFIIDQPGTYNGHIDVFATNSAHAETLRIPASLVVAPPSNARMKVVPPSLAFGEISSGEIKTLSLLVKNIGLSPLQVTNIVIGSVDFSATPTSFTLNYLDTQRVFVSFTPSGSTGPKSSSLSFSSNDPASPVVPLTGTSVLGFWTSQNSGTGYSLFSVSTVDDNVAWVSGDGGIVLRTTNGGTSWQTFSVLFGYGRNVSALNATTAFVCVNSLSGDNAYLYRTTDGGGSWTAVHSLSQTGAYFDAVHMFDALNGILLGNPLAGFWYLAKTTNGGANWTQISGPAQLSGEVGYDNAFEWSDNQHGWFGSNKRHIYRTTNGGTGWTAVIAPFDQCVGVAFANGQSGIAGGILGTNARSTDGGATWQSSTLSGSDNVYPSGIATLPPRWWSASGPRIYSTDNQIQWSYDLLASNYFRHINMKLLPALKKIVGYAVGDAGQIYRYTETVPPYRPVVSVHPDWNLLSVPLSVGDYHKHVLFPTAKSPAFAYEGTYVEKSLLSRKAGYWIKFDSSQTFALQGAMVSNDSFSVRQGWNLMGTISIPVVAATISSIPSGIISSQFFGFNSGYHAVDSLIPGNGYWVRANANGQLLLSSSGPLENDAPSVQSTLTALNTLTIEDAGGHRQTLYFGEQPDQKFDVKRYEMPPRPMEGAFDVRFASQSMVEVSDGLHARDCPILVSAASFPLNISWKMTGSAEAASLSVGAKLLPLAGEEALTVSNPEDRIVLHLGSGTRLPKEFALYQNYPNPFNPTTSIKFDLPRQSLVTLVVYDVLGKEIERLRNNELLEGGRYEQSLNAASLATGVYFYRLQAGEFTSVKKMILIK